ncbi:DIS3-like exonuclease 2 (hDIS3L2) [Durusdinium trenchii]|uniref:DIS3-like exonuclease 2 (HDIS3L2) n=1 Tax=Durusdinium trenchii TaxID=1381693 RepID=A0ABP0HEH8_9DINO
MENTIYTEYFSNPCTSSLRPHESSRLDVFCQLEEVNECLPPADYQIPAEEVAKRTDFRKLCIFSIDPPGCEDVDDALHCYKLANGNFSVGVHIADVTHFVRAGSELDREGAERATSVYLVNRRVDMLPRLLTTDICSLRCDGKDRLCFSVVFEMSPKAKVISASFEKGILRSRAALAYKEASLARRVAEPFLRSGESPRSFAPEHHELCRFRELPVDVAACGAACWAACGARKIIIQGAVRAFPRAQELLDTKSSDEIGQSIQHLAMLARQLREKRREDGALELEGGEMKFELDTNTQLPTNVFKYESYFANNLIEEFMLLANRTVAEELTRHYPKLSLLRRHPPPKARASSAVGWGAEAYGIKDFSYMTNKKLQSSLNAVEHKDDPFFNRLVREMATRCMEEAVYFCTGSLKPGKKSMVTMVHHIQVYIVHGKLVSGWVVPAAPGSFHPFFLSIIESPSHAFTRMFRRSAMEMYTHFTSPIRRYADCVVHRLLSATLGVEKLPGMLQKKKALRWESNARWADRASVEFHLYQFFRKQGAVTVEGVVMRVMYEGISVAVEDYGAEGIAELDAKSWGVLKEPTRRSERHEDMA